jgi:hypothetical protein
VTCKKSEKWRAARKECPDFFLAWFASTNPETLVRPLDEEESGEVRVKRRAAFPLYKAGTESNATPGVSASSVRKRLKNKEIAKLLDPSVRRLFGR